MFRKPFLFLCVNAFLISGFAESVIINHTSTRLSHVPPEYIDLARKQLRVAFAHSGIGDQIIQGMDALRERNLSLFSYNWSGRGDALSFWNRSPPGDLGTPDRRAWVARTREFLRGRGSDRNLMVWLWGDQVGNAEVDDIDTYLENMAELEREFPRVRFVYATGRLNGTGELGNLHRRNEQIREFCRDNGKILYDFADIESFDPDGKINYNKLFGRSSCDYVDGEHRGNWAREWVRKNQHLNLALPLRVVDTEPLNAALKARAFWFMLARLAGWQPPSDIGDRPFAPIRSETEYLQDRDESARHREQEPARRTVSLSLDFAETGDFRWWREFGTLESLIPEDGKTLLVPSGTPALAVFRKKIPAEELEFTATLASGHRLIWCVNTDLSPSFPPKTGIVGVMDTNGCAIYLDGQAHVLPGSVKLQSDWPYQSRITVGPELVRWEIGRKLVGEIKTASSMIREGTLAIGGEGDSLTVSAVSIKWKEDIPPEE